MFNTVTTNRIASNSHLQEVCVPATGLYLLAASWLRTDWKVWRCWYCRVINMNNKRVAGDWEVGASWKRTNVISSTRKAWASDADWYLANSEALMSSYHINDPDVWSRMYVVLVIFPNLDCSPSRYQRKKWSVCVVTRVLRVIARGYGWKSFKGVDLGCHGEPPRRSVKEFAFILPWFTGMQHARNLAWTTQELASKRIFT